MKMLLRRRDQLKAPAQRPQSTPLVTFSTV